MARHEYESVQVGKNSEAPATGIDESTPATESLKWRPSYLPRRVLAGCCVVFAMVLIALETLLAVSSKNDGIASASYNEHYLWTYGPTAFLTIVAAIFSRVEYQSKLIAPWERMSKQPGPASHTLLLDYVSQFQPLTVYKSLKNKDVTVSVTTTVSLLIKLLIVLSTGLITLTPTQVTEHSVPMVIQNKFVDDNTSLVSIGTLPYYFMEGVAAGNMTYPDGISKGFAFQQVRNNLADTAQIKFTVDGFTNSLDCEPVDVRLTLLEHAKGTCDDGECPNYMELDVTSSDCNITFKNDVLQPDRGSDNPTIFGRLPQGQCNGTTDDAGKRILVMFGHFQYITQDDGTQMSDLLKSTQLLCSPTYQITKVDVVQIGTNTQSVALSPSAPSRSLEHVTPWSIMQAHFDSYEENGVIFSQEQGPNSKPPYFPMGNVPIDVDEWMSMLLRSQVTSGTAVSMLDDQGYVRDIATGYYRAFGAVVAHQGLMDATSISAVGSAVINENRLIVQNWAVQWMAGLVAVCLILTFIAIFTIPKHGILPHSPTTTITMAALVAHSPDLLKRLRDFGDADEKTLCQLFETSAFRSGVELVVGSNQHQRFTITDTSYMERNDDMLSFTQSMSKHSHPGTLHPVSRLVLCLVLVGLIIALELALHKSAKDNGLGDVGNGAYIHYLWTSIPGLIFGILATTISSMDSTVRSLVPYTMLQKFVPTHFMVTLDFLDVSVPRAIYKEVKVRNVGAFATTTMLLVASFFTIFSASLFQSVSLSAIDLIVLRANNSFDQSISTLTIDGDERASLILETNQSYPAFTYENLAFPQLIPKMPTLMNVDSNSSSLLIKTVVPAVRGKLECHMYDASSITTNLTIDYIYKGPSTNLSNPLGINIEGEECLLQPDDEANKYNKFFGTSSNASYFGQTGSNSDSFYSACSKFLFIWGSLDYSANPQVSHIAAMGCNQSFETVDVDTTFIGTNLTIGSENPPHPREDTASDSTVINGYLDVASWYSDVATENTPQLLSNVFSLLVTSRWAIPVSNLGDPSKNQIVADALRFQTGIVVAQVLNTNRVLANNTNATLAHAPLDLHDGSDARTFNATATDPAGRQRVVQDAASTRIIEALLLVSLLLLILAWVSLPKANVLPDRSPTTIASVIALVAGGNLLDFLSKDVESLSYDDIVKAFGEETQFRMGWGLLPDVEGEATGNHNENGVSRFGVFGVRPE
ncbi:hypothetical protein BHYA_0004g01010 [Botrytis hyacinthi]|uniref:Uncharacterized protein n=1 Tax=Botrytis hyacinthi TaxID=278943 RepID=A0A4Z1H2K4_9HELO|nr:hypothetical protein BHYA_0004g01010 [Botrytis hyacinthi]